MISNTLRKNQFKASKPYLEVLSELPVAVLLVDNQGIIKFFNKELEDLSGFESAEIIDMPASSLFQPEKGRNIQLSAIITPKTYKGKVYTHKFKGRKGKAQGISLLSQPTYFPGLEGLTTVFIQPVTEKANDEFLSDLTGKFSRIQELANCGYWEMDGKKDRWRGNTLSFSIFGLNTSQTSISYLDFLSLFNRKEDRRSIERGLITIENTPQVFEEVVKVKKGQNKEFKTVYLKLMARWMDDSAGGMFYGIIQDVTEAKKIEKEILRAKEKAERADALKTNFLTNLSYEIRTPMNAILGFAELLNLEDLSREQKVEYTKNIRSKGNSLLSMIDDGIELSRFETGNISINKTEFNLHPLLSELYNEFESKRRQLSKNSLSIELKLPEGSEKEKIYTDSGRLQQLLSNLLSNALKFTEKGQVEFGYRKSGKFYKFYVKDTGIGIEEKDQNLIFNRFRQVEETTSRKFAGGGLNLTISRHIVELLGGKIKLKSELNKGSRFQISIPAESVKHKKGDMTEFEDINSINWKDRVILIAEDEEVNYRFLEAVLHKTHCQVLRAKTGTEAIELCKNISKIDLVLMDIKMPEMNGFEATREIKALRKSLPVIAQTAFSSQDELVKCRLSGCDDIITKPIDIKQLFRKMNELLQ